MAEALEIVFEEVDVRAVQGLLGNLLSHGREVAKIWCSEKDFLMPFDYCDGSELERLVGFDRDMVLFFDVRDMGFSEVILPAVLVRLVKYSGKFDIDFNFEFIGNISLSGLMRSLHRDVTALAGIFAVKSFFGGIEPANDVETQFFCEEKFGPMM